MSNKRDRRRKGVIYPGQSGTGRSQNTFFTETEKEPFLLFSAGKWQDADCRPEECSDVINKNRTRWSGFEKINCFNQVLSG